MKKSTRRLVWVLLFVAAVIAVGSYCLVERILFQRELNMETHALGHVLVVFAEDNRRPAQSFEELQSMGYLTRAESGMFTLGDRGRRRTSEIGPSLFDTIRHRDRFHLRAGGPEGAGTGYFSVDGDEPVRKTATWYNNRVLELLAGQGR